MRSATAALRRPSAAIESSGPPTIAVAELALESAEHRGPGDGAQADQPLVLFLRDARGVHEEHAEQDRRVRGQGRDALPHLLERKRVQPREPKAPAHGTQLLLELGVPELLERGVAEHDDEGRRVGQEPEDVRDDGRGVDVEVDHDLVRLLRELRPVAGVEAGDRAAGPPPRARRGARPRSAPPGPPIVITRSGCRPVDERADVLRERAPLRRRPRSARARAGFPGTRPAPATGGRSPCAGPRRTRRTGQSGSRRS